MMRRTNSEIAEIRSERSPTLLLTGVTGFLGSHLAVELLQRGYKLILPSRPKGRLSARERVAQRMRWFGHDILRDPRCRIIEAQLGQERLGIAEKEYATLLNTVDEIIHCAADTSFAERKREQVERANLESLHNLLKLAVGSRCYFFHQISTAYVAGRRTGFCPEELSEAREFHNVYEETKCGAEQRAFEACSSAGIRLNIFRPSIVFGDSRNGRSFRFTALYYPVKLINYMRGLYLQDIREDGGRHARAMGICLRDSGALSLPIRIENGRDGSMNVIPVDHFVEAAMALMDQSREGDIFHIVNPRPVPLDRIIDFVQRFLNLEGIASVSREEYAESPPSPLEMLVRRQLGAYLPYMQDRRIFLREKAGAILEAQGIACPDFDYPLFERCITYALEVDWGKNQ